MSWYVERHEGTKIKDADGNTVLWTQHTHLLGRRTDEEVMEIAVLAAAAPELLAALKLLHAHLFGPEPEQKRHVIDALCRAVIAKAEGQS